MPCQPSTLDSGRLAASATALHKLLSIKWQIFKLRAQGHPSPSILLDLVVERSADIVKMLLVNTYGNCAERLAQFRWGCEISQGV